MEKKKVLSHTSYFLNSCVFNPIATDVQSLPQEVCQVMGRTKQLSELDREDLWM